MEHWKLKLQNIIHNTEFCGICLNIRDHMNMIHDEFEVANGEQSHSKTLAFILSVVFKDPFQLANCQICNKCTQRLIQSYIFIKEASETSRLLNTCLNDLYNKTCYIQNNILNKDQDCSILHNIVITLDKNIFKENINCGDGNIKEIPEQKIDVTSKKNIKCLTCNIVLPSHIPWRIHEKTYKHKQHRKSCFKTSKSQSFIKHNKSHLRSRCKICLRKIQDGRLLQHLKDNHRQSTRLCSVCNIAFYSVEELECHRLEWHGDGNRCLTCLKSYTEADLEQHECRFRCTICSESPCVHHKYLMCYREQILNGILTPRCLDCSFFTNSKENMLVHANMQHINKHICNICDQTFPYKSDLNTHILNCHKNMCLNCDTEFTSPMLYSNHIKDCVGSKETKSEKRCLDISKSVIKFKTNGRRKDIFPCGLCNRIYFTDLQRRTHMIKAHGTQRKRRIVILDCVVCQETFSCKGDLVQHMKSHGSNVKYPCRVCNKQYDTLRQYRAHSRKHIGPFAVCEICGKEMRQILLRKHMTTHTNSIVTCATCGKSFKNTALLKYHQKVHLDSVPCPKCAKLVNPAKLRRHYKNHIIQENPGLKAAAKQTASLKCELCEYKTWNNILLECHMNRHHLKVRPYICHICSKAFIGKHLLKKHIDTHTVDKSVVCMICLKKFANAACLKMHLRLHTGETPFTCEICGDRFRSSSILNVHKLKKHSEKNNHCPLCENKFHTVRDLRRHIMKVHWKEKEKKFNPRELNGLREEHYHLFHDGRRVKMHKEDIEF